LPQPNRKLITPLVAAGLAGGLGLNFLLARFTTSDDADAAGITSVELVTAETAEPEPPISTEQESPTTPQPTTVSPEQNSETDLGSGGFIIQNGQVIELWSEDWIDPDAPAQDEFFQPALIDDPAVETQAKDQALQVVQSIIEHSDQPELLRPLFTQTVADTINWQAFTLSEPVAIISVFDVFPERNVSIGPVTRIIVALDVQIGTDDAARERRAIWHVDLLHDGNQWLATQAVWERMFPIT